MTPVVSVRGLVRTFGSVRALDGLDLEMQHGQVVALLGHNGAGKTTTLRHLTGVLAPTTGTVEVFGVDPLTDGVAIRQRTGVLTARPGIDAALTGRGNLAVVGDLWGLPRRVARERAEVLLADLGLAGSADVRAETYSTGMQQRLALARVLLHEPDLLLLDEPTAALDPVGARQVREVIAALAREEGRSVVLCTHNLAEAQEICDRVVVLEHGRVLVDGTPSELVARLPGRGLVLDVAVEDVAAATTVLTERGLAADGGAAELRVAGVVRAQVPDLLAALIEHGVRIHAARPETATLEDVYLELHGAGREDRSP